MEEVRNSYKIVVRKPGSPRNRWKDINKIDVKQRGFESVDWIYLVQGKIQWRAVVNTVMNF
jgi:hypothetical protein